MSRNPTKDSFIHATSTTEKITQQRMAETARRARIHADRGIPRRERRTFAFPRFTWRRTAIRTA